MKQMMMVVYYRNYTCIQLCISIIIMFDYNFVVNVSVMRVDVHSNTYNTYNIQN